MCNRRRLALLLGIAVVPMGAYMLAYFLISSTLPAIDPRTPGAIPAACTRAVSSIALWVFALALSGFAVGRTTSSRFAYPLLVGLVMGLELVALEAMGLAWVYGLARVRSVIRSGTWPIAMFIMWQLPPSLLGGLLGASLGRHRRSEHADDQEFPKDSPSG